MSKLGDLYSRVKTPAQHQRYIKDRRIMQTLLQVTPEHLKRYTEPELERLADVIGAEAEAYRRGQVAGSTPEELAGLLSKLRREVSRRRTGGR